MLPYLGNSSIRTVYFTYFAIHAWFTQATWYVYFLNIASPGQIALLHTVGFLVALSMDLPTGYLADKFGRKRVLSLGLFLFTAGLALFGVVQTVWQMFLFEIIVQIGLACISGALEAVLHDTVSLIEPRETKRDTLFNLVYSKCRMIINFSLIVSALVGGIVYKYSDRAPWFMMAVLCFTAFILARKLPNIKGIQDDSVTSPLLHTKEAFSLFWQQKNRYLLPGIALLGGVAFLSDWGIFYVGSLEELGIDPFGISALLVVVYSIGLITNYFLPKIYTCMKGRRGFVTYGILVAFLLCLGGILQQKGFKLNVLVIGAYMILSGFSQGYITSTVSESTADNYRATALSASGLVVKLLYMATALIMGLNFARGNGTYNFWMYASISVLGVGLIIIMRPRKIEKQLG